MLTFLSSCAIAAMIIIFVVISLRAPVTPWGDVSQALIYHQVPHIKHLESFSYEWEVVTRYGSCRAVTVPFPRILFD